jgi:endonuclease-8
VPEGDTVWNTARALRDALAGRELTGSDFRVPQLATTDLSGWTVTDSISRGKHLFLRLRATSGTEHSLHSHLRMDGSWRIFRAGERWHGGPAHTIRVALTTAENTAVGYHIHEIELVPRQEEHTFVDHLGPDLLGADWDADEAVRRLRAQPDRTIAEGLLDQRNLAGIGNLYKCELLYLRGISPWTPVGEVPDLDALVRLAYRLMNANRGRWTQSTTGSLRRGENTYVYGRRAAPCRRCGTAIEKAEQGDRVTYWCPRCQPARPGAVPD